MFVNQLPLELLLMEQCGDGVFLLAAGVPASACTCDMDVVLLLEDALADRELDLHVRR